MPVAGYGSIASSALKEERTTMEFTSTWGEGPVFEWYRNLQKSCAIIDRLEIRIEGGKPPHRFVLAYLENGTVCRFDRRPETAKPATLFLETFLNKPMRRAADDYAKPNEEARKKIEAETFCEVNMKMPAKTDLILVLSACFAIHQDTHTCNYELLKYNCYFFSWTIVMIVARHALPFVMPPKEAVVERLGSAVDILTDSITRKLSKALLDLVLDTITTFRAETGRKLNNGLSKRELLVWGLPTDVVRFVIRRCLIAVCKIVEPALLEIDEIITTCL